MDITKLYIPSGLVKDQEAELKLSHEDAKKTICERAFEVSARYESGSSILYFDKLTRTAVHVLCQNHLVDEKTKTAIFGDMELCDSILLRLRDLVTFTLKCDSRARFLVKLGNFVEGLSTAERELLGDCVGTLKRWGVSGIPAEPKENDIFLMEVFNECKSAIPSEIDAELHNDFMIDRFEKIDRVIQKISDGGKI
jgi:hypothetical protein